MHNLQCCHLTLMCLGSTVNFSIFVFWKHRTTRLWKWKESLNCWLSTEGKNRWLFPLLSILDSRSLDSCWRYVWSSRDFQYCHAIIIWKYFELSDLMLWWMLLTGLETDSSYNTKSPLFAGLRTGGNGENLGMKFPLGISNSYRRQRGRHMRRQQKTKNCSPMSLRLAFTTSS